MSVNRGSELEIAGYADAGYTRYFLYDVLKRLLDIAGALIGIVLLSGLFITVALWIKWENPKGSVIFRQQRIGKNGRPFTIYKFRSMVHNAEELQQQLQDKNEMAGAMFKMKDDPRITRVGQFIRKTSIDELPQFFNVLKGDMSLVGPRPPLPREVEEYTGYHKRRLLVTPGCTGMWQISGRSTLGFEEMVQLDIDYIRRRNLWLDLIIICKTARVLLGSKDAY